MKILLLITNLGKGGAQRVFYDHAIAFSQQFEVHEAVFDIQEDERLYHSGLPLHSLDVKGGNNPVLKLLRLFQRAKKLRRLVAQHKFNLVISHMDGANWVNVLSGSAAKKILVVHGTVLHDYAVSPFVSWLRKQVLIPWLYRQAQHTVAVSEGIANELRQKAHLKNITVLPNYFNIAAISANAEAPVGPFWQRLFEQFPVLITTGRLHEQKKQAFLFPVLSGLKKNFPELKLVLLGDGPLRNSLIQSALAEGLQVFNKWHGGEPSIEHEVFFLGHESNPFRYLKRSTLFLFPSGWEGFPLALCEAMICNVPVLSADCPTGPREILAPGTKDDTYSLQQAEPAPYGYLMPMTDKAGATRKWQETIGKLLKNEYERNALSEAAFKHMQAYDQSQLISRWINLVAETASEQTFR